MQPFNVRDLIPHPKNEYFFDEMTGQKWEEFLESVRTSGVIEPPVVTDKRVIVSGHQRIRACLELGTEVLSCEVRIYDNEDKVIKDLIETNMRQRGTIAGSELKMGRIIKELERIYGVKEGRPSKSSGNSTSKTQAEIAEEIGISPDVYKAAKKLTTLPEEFQQMVEDGAITPSTATRFISRLTEEEQMRLLEVLPAAQKFTQLQVQGYIDQIKGLTETNGTLAQETADALRAAKANEDGKEYLRMKNRLKEKEEEARKYYEDLQAEKKKNEDKPPKPDAIKEAEKKTEERMRREYRKLAEGYEQRILELENSPAPEPETIEIIPDDYEELKSKVAAYEAKESNTANSFFDRFKNSSEQFLSDIEDFALAKLSSTSIPTETLSEIVDNLRSIVNHCTSVIKAAKDLKAA